MKTESKRQKEIVKKLRGVFRFSLGLLILHFTFLLFTSTTLAQLVKSVDAVGMTVSDMDRSVEFFSKVLSFEKVSDVEVVGSKYERLQGLFGVRMRIVRMRLGDELIELSEYLAPRGRPIPADSRSNDQWFQHVAIVVSDMDKAYEQLRVHKVQHTSTGPQRIPDWNKTAAGIKAFYFKDPDGHNLELIYFPPGKGDSKWQQTNGRLFLGIDHTAIAVSDTEHSLQFYRDMLGMKLAGESENYGTEQEHLNHVFGSRSAHQRAQGAVRSRCRVPGIPDATRWPPYTVGYARERLVALANSD